MVARKKDENILSMVDTFKEFKDTKNIDRMTLVSVLEESFRNVLARIFGMGASQLVSLYIIAVDKLVSLQVYKLTS